MDICKDLSLILQFKPLRFKIFAFLPVESLRGFLFVSKQFSPYVKEYVKEAKNLNIKQRDFALMTTGKKFRPFFSLFSNIKSLELSCRKLELSFVSCLPKQLTSLKLTNLKPRHISNAQFYCDMTTRLESLESLKLHFRSKYSEDCYYSIEQEMFEAFTAMLLTMKKLKAFEFYTACFSKFIKLYVQGLYAVTLLAGHNLTSLTLSNFVFNHQTSFDGLFLEQLRELVILNESEELSDTSWLISQNFLSHIAIHFPNLTTLRIYEQSSYSNIILNQNTVVDLVKAYPGLEILELYYRGSSVSIPHVGLMTCFNMLPALRELTLSSCKTLDAASIRELVEKNRFLRKINFDYSLCDDYALGSILEFYGKRNVLKDLSLKACGKITEDGFKFFFATMEGLEALNVSKNYHVTGEVLQVIVLTSPNLKNLAVSHCENVGNGVLCMLLSSLRLLKKFTFSHMTESNCSTITADCFQGLEDMVFERLTSLCFCYLEYIDDSTVEDILRMFPNLEKLKLGGCKQLTKQTIRILEKSKISKRLKVMGLQTIPKIVFKDKNEIGSYFKDFNKLVSLEVD